MSLKIGGILLFCCNHKTARNYGTHKNANLLALYGLLFPQESLAQTISSNVVFSVGE
jgi:hypothetical protein